jgi:hypothetical protein
MASSIDFETKSQLKCVNCNKVFDDALMKHFPCGEIVCQACLKELKTNNSLIKCQKCAKNHKNESEMSLNETLGKFESNIIDFSSSIDDAKEKLKARCDYVKDELEISVESVIDELNKFKLRIFTEIDEYEEKCVENIDNLDVDERVKFKEIILKCQQQLNEWKNIKIKSKDEVSRISQEASSLTNELKNGRNEFEKYFYGDRVIGFKERTNEVDSSILGKLIYRSYIDNGERFLVDIERLKELKEPKNVTYLTGDSLKTIGVHLSFLEALIDNQLVLCTYEVRNVAFTVCLRVYDSNGLLVRKNFENINTHLISMSAFENNICVILRDNLAHHSLKLYDVTNLKLTKQINLGFLPIASAMDNSKIYIISLQDAFLVTFNMNLEPVPTRIHNGDNVHYLPMLCRMRIKKDKLFIKNDHDLKIRIISLTNGNIEKRFSFPESTNCFFDIDFSLKIFAFNVNQKKLKVFEWQDEDNEMNLIYEKSLGDSSVIRNGRSLCVTDLGYLVINDPPGKNFSFF